MKKTSKEKSNTKTEKFVSAVIKGKNLKAQQMLEDLIKEKAVKRIKDVLDN